MLSPRLKSSFLSALLAAMLLLGGAGAQAEVRLYQYDGNLPFIQMMLNMMVAMGILDRLPSYGPYGSAYASPYGYGLSPWSALSGADYANPYRRAFGLGGLSPYSAYGGNPFVRSPWLASPWTAASLGSGIWGDPRWGVLPADSYSPYYPDPYAVPYDDLTAGWVNEPWETSVWNPDADTAASAGYGENIPGDSGHNRSAKAADRDAGNGRPAQAHPPGRSPLAKLAPQQPRAQGRPRVKQKPCITDFCGLKKPDIDGLWVSQDGEMLGIKSGHFLWSDGVSRYLSGRLRLSNEYLLVSVDETSAGPVSTAQVMPFKYKLAGNRLLTLQPDGVIKEFVRTAPGY